LGTSNSVDVLKGHGFSRAAKAEKRAWALQAAEKLISIDILEGFVSGHDFSRAANAAKISVGL
jgi:hypothetical protein